MKLGATISEIAHIFKEIQERPGLSPCRRIFFRRRLDKRLGSPIFSLSLSDRFATLSKL